MNKLIERINRLFVYYKRFGYHGAIFLIKKYLKQNQNIVFSLSNYLFPIILRNNTTDLLTFEQVILDNDYDINYGFVPEVIIDCGANIGLASIFFKNKFPHAKIISIEPEQSNFEILLKNTNKYKDIYSLKNGIWNKSANLAVKDIGEGKWGFTVEEVDEKTENSVSAITINEIMKKFDIDTIDILKIDIEGSEKELFESNFEEWLPKTKVLIIELHERFRSGSSISFYKAVSKNNYTMSQKGENIICFRKQNEIYYKPII